MYEFVVSFIGEVPSEFTFIYGLATLFMFISFVVLLMSPIILIICRKKGRRKL